jgi:hypothetical protein
MFKKLKDPTVKLLGEEKDFLLQITDSTVLKILE